MAKPGNYVYKNATIFLLSGTYALWNRNEVTFLWWIIITHLVLKQSWILYKYRSYFLLSWIKKYVVSELKWSQGKISALSLPSATLPVFPLSKGFTMKLKVHVSLIEFLLILSLYNITFSGWEEQQSIWILIFTSIYFGSSGSWIYLLSAQRKMIALKLDQFPDVIQHMNAQSYVCTTRQEVSDRNEQPEWELFKKANTPEMCMDPLPQPLIFMLHLHSFTFL